MLVILVFFYTNQDDSKRLWLVKLLFHSSADALFVAVKVHLFVELGGLLALTRQKTTFLGRSNVKKMASWHRLLGWFQICLRVRCAAAMELETYSSRVLGGEPVATNSCSVLMSKLFAAKSRTLSEGTSRICYDSFFCCDECTCL